MVDYARGGELVFRVERERGRIGIAMLARDRGPGIADVSRAMQDGFSTKGSLGLGLPGARRMMDSFEIESAPGRGTTISMKKWAGAERA